MALWGEQHILERSHKPSLSQLSGCRSYSTAFCLPYKIFITSAAALYRVYLHPGMKKLLSQGHSGVELPFDSEKMWLTHALPKIGLVCAPKGPQVLDQHCSFQETFFKYLKHGAK